MPASDGGDDFIWIGGPDEGFWAFVVLIQEAVDGGLEVDERMEYAAFEPSVGQPGEEPLDGIEPGTRGWRKVEGEARVPDEPLADLEVLVGGVVVEDHVDRLSGGHLCFDQVEKADELLMAVPLHVAADHGPVEHVERGKERGGAVALIIMGHRPGPPLLERQAGLRTVERLDLAFLIERQDDRMGRRCDIKADDVAEFGDELRVIGELELPNAVRLEAVGTPDPVNRTGANARFAGHKRSRPVGRLTRWGLLRPRHNQGDGLRVQSRDARRTGLIAQQTINALGHETLLPAPHACLGLARLPHDRSRAEAAGAEQHDLGSPDVLLGGVAIPHHSLKAEAVRWRNFKCDPGAHPAESHGRSLMGIPNRTQMSGGNH